MTDCETKKAAYEHGRHDALEEVKDVLMQIFGEMIERK